MKKGENRFHIFYALRILRYGLLLCLVPMVRALLRFDLPSLFTALWQDFYILALCSVASVVLWLCTGFCVENGVLTVRQGVLVKRVHTLSAQSVAAVEVRRSLLYRLFGAAQLTVYFKTMSMPRSLTLHLPRKAAQQAAELLLPVKQDNSVFEPTGFERFAFVMLSANALTSWLFITVSAKRISEVLGNDWRKIAMDNFTRIELMLAKFLPAGAAVLTALFFVVVSVTFLYSLLHTAGFQVCRNGGVIILRGGLITKLERRILVQSVTSCDVRVTPVARLLRRYPVYLTAGSFSGGDMPVMVVRGLEDMRPQSLLFGYSAPPKNICNAARKSWGQYLWKPGLTAGAGLVLSCAALAVMPKMLPVLAVPVVLGTVCLLVSFEALQREGVWKNENRTLAVCYSKWFTRHEVCVLTPNVAYTTFQHPMALHDGWADFTVQLPCGVRYRARGVAQYIAHHVPFTL